MAFLSKEYSGIRTGTEASFIIKSTDFLPYQQMLSRVELKFGREKTSRIMVKVTSDNHNGEKMKTH